MFGISIGSIAAASLFNLIFWGFCLAILYFVIKLAVKSAIRETRNDYRPDKEEQ